MKKILMMVLVAGAGYFVWSQYSPGMTGNPVYAEVRVRESDMGVELLGLGVMNSEGDCQARAALFWESILVTGTSFKLASMKCIDQIPDRLKGLFENRQYHASYISFEKGNSGERDGRFVIYGVPSSELTRFCPAFISKAKEKYSGKVECIIGSVG